MGPNPVTKCVTILAVFNADCLTILPDFADESFPHCPTFNIFPLRS